MAMQLENYREQSITIRLYSSRILVSEQYLLLARELSLAIYNNKVMQLENYHERSIITRTCNSRIIVSDL